MNSLSLMRRSPGDPLIAADGRIITVGEFLAQAEALANQLPPAACLINLCRGRYAFSVAFAAVLMAGRTSLLPANRLQGTVRSLIDRYPDCAAISEDVIDGLECPLIQPGEAMAVRRRVDTIPEIAADHPAAIVFTSGSTGTASAVTKPWRTFHDSSRVNVARTGLADAPFHAVATVPAQHMWGLETSVLGPWFAPVVMADGQPFYAADVIDFLERLDAPRALISTPVHLRALVESGRTLPKLELILSATAPLSPKLAARLEHETGARVTEIYGCSEAGSLAHRRTALDEPWTLFEVFEASRSGEVTVIDAGHLPEPVELMDFLEFETGGRFRLAGRHADLVNIAGKRASLAELTQVLLDLPGVFDGVIFQPPETDHGPVSRLAAMVVAPGLTASQIRRQLHGRVDAAFMPRPLHVVEALPRAESGKLPRESLLALFERVSATA